MEPEPSYFVMIVPRIIVARVEGEMSLEFATRFRAVKVELASGRIQGL